MRIYLFEEILEIHGAVQTTPSGFLSLLLPLSALPLLPFKPSSIFRIINCALSTLGT